jgi:N-acetylneuraminate lyase
MTLESGGRTFRIPKPPTLDPHAVRRRGADDFIPQHPMSMTPSKNITPIQGAESLGAFSGLIAAPFTAYDRDGNVALEKIPRQAEALAAGGVKGVFVCGTTGEGALLTPDERVQIARRWIDVAGQSLKVIVNVSADSPGLMRDLAEDAQRSKASAIGCSSPSYFIPKGADDLIRVLQVVTSKASALPFYYYHIPSFTHTRFPASEVIVAASEMENFAGVKFTDENLMDFAACVELCGPRQEMLFGRDEMFMAGLAFGASGAVGSTYNFAAPLYLEIHRHMLRGEIDLARQLQRTSHKLIEALMAAGGVIPAGKALMAMLGIDCGSVRPPLVPITREAAKALGKTMAELGVFPNLNPEAGTEAP